MTPPRINPDLILPFLTGELGLDASRLEALMPGAWSAAYAFSAGEVEWVVRFSEHESDFACDHYAARFHAPDLPIPRVTYRGQWSDLHVAISERVSGKFFDDLATGELRQVTPNLARLLCALQRADVSVSSGYGGWDMAGNGTHDSWAGFLRGSLQDTPDYRGGAWRAKLEQSPIGATAFDRDIAVLDRLVPDLPDARHLIHSDLLNFNLFVRDDDISGVIDWGCALYGDFLYELAWFDFWWPWYPQWTSVDIVSEALDAYANSGADLYDADLRIKAYKLHIGLTHQAYHSSIGNWQELENVALRTTSVADELR